MGLLGPVGLRVWWAFGFDGWLADSGCHELSEIVWFVSSGTSHSGDVSNAGTNERQGKKVLLSSLSQRH